MIEVVKVKDREEGNQKAHDILKDIIDDQTLLALCGGTSVDYTKVLVEPGDVAPGAICVIDERYGEPFHENSNELLMRNMGVVDFAQKKSIEMHKILSGKPMEETVNDYEKTVEDLFKRFLKRVAICGVGANMHTAGIFPNSNASHLPNLVVGETVGDKQSLRSSTSSAGLRFPQRITLTLKALGEFQYFLVLMFGEEKKEALLKILDENVNDMQKYPAIFYRKCFAKCYLITDIDL